MDARLCGFFHVGLSRVIVRVRSLCDLGHERWSEKSGVPGLHYSQLCMLVSSYALPACDGQTDMLPIANLCSNLEPISPS